MVLELSYIEHATMMFLHASYTTDTINFSLDLLPD